MYTGVETQQTSCGNNATASVYFSATEYLFYGSGSTHNLTIRPTSPTTERKEYKVQDMLGSTRVIIEPDGMGGGVITGQYDYEPFGGINWQSGQSSRLSFIDKEKDVENALGDFGVRKYDDEIGRFTSIDPLWEEYRAWSPYHYCANNPLIFVDPNGKAIKQVYDENATEKEKRKDRQDYESARRYLKQKGIDGVFSRIEKSDEVIKIKIIRGDVEENSSRYDAGSMTLYFNPNHALMTGNGAQTPAIGLLHEAGHAIIHIEAIESGKESAYWERTIQETLNKLKDPSYVKPEEQEVLRRFEIPATRHAKEGVRMHYQDGIPYESYGPTTTSPTPAGTRSLREQKSRGDR